MPTTTQSDNRVLLAVLFPARPCLQLVRVFTATMMQFKLCYNWRAGAAHQGLHLWLRCARACASGCGCDWSFSTAGDSRIHTGIHPGKIRCYCDNDACPRGIRGVERCGGRTCGGLEGRPDVCVRAVGFEIPKDRSQEFRAALTRAPGPASVTFSKHINLHACHFDPAHPGFGTAGQRC